MQTNNCTIAVFAKAPRPGKAKTRLIPLLGPEGASNLQCRLLEHTLRVANAACIGPIELWCSPDTSEPALQSASKLVSASLHAQGEGDLGNRMAQAFRDILARSPRCVLIGSDCPSLTIHDLKEAASALDQHTVVLGPAEDGGYVLIGLRRGTNSDFSRIFQDIAWGAETVLQSTRERLKEQGLAWHELAMRWDVDRPEDYERLYTEMPELART